jgi:hypothetical protein
MEKYYIIVQLWGFLPGARTRYKLPMPGQLNQKGIL